MHLTPFHAFSVRSQSACEFANPTSFSHNQIFTGLTPGDRFSPGPVPLPPHASSEIMHLTPFYAFLGSFAVCLCLLTQRSLLMSRFSPGWLPKTVSPTGQHPIHRKGDDAFDPILCLSRFLHSLPVFANPTSVSHVQIFTGPAPGDRFSPRPAPHPLQASSGIMHLTPYAFLRSFAVCLNFLTQLLFA
jgi:hypothetical protein